MLVILKINYNLLYYFIKKVSLILAQDERLQYTLHMLVKCLNIANR